MCLFDFLYKIFTWNVTLAVRLAKLALNRRINQVQTFEINRYSNFH